MSGSSRLVTISSTTSWQRVQVSSCLGRRMNVTSPQKLNDAQNSSGLNEAIFVKEKRGIIIHQTRALSGVHVEAYITYEMPAFRIQLKYLACKLFKVKQQYLQLKRAKL